MTTPTSNNPYGFPQEAVEFVTNVHGAISITMTVLGAYGRPVVSGDDFPRDDWADLREMERLCHDLGVEAGGLEHLKGLLKLQDQFVEQGRKVSVEQATQAKELVGQYTDWIFPAFPDIIRRVSAAS